jgi:putative PIN family toxin of toxin-antitoxin system
VIRVVIDTNVLVSGLLSLAGNEALLILAVHQGLVRPYLSKHIMAEDASVLARPKFAFPPDQISALIAMLRDSGDVVEPVTVPQPSPDPADTKFLSCAAAAQVDFLVTGNKRDFPHTPYGPTRVVNAGELLDRIILEL